MKAVLELEMPESCYKCRLCYFATFGGIRCAALNGFVVRKDYERDKKCPLKLKRKRHESNI